MWVGGWVVVSLQARAGSSGLHAWPGVLPAAELPGWAASLAALACALPGNRSALAHSAPAPPPLACRFDLTKYLAGQPLQLMMRLRSTGEFAYCLHVHHERLLARSGGKQK